MPRRRADADTVEVRIVNHHFNRETEENYVPGETKTLPTAEAERLVRGHVARYVDADDGESSETT